MTAAFRHPLHLFRFSVAILPLRRCISPFWTWHRFRDGQKIRYYSVSCVSSYISPVFPYINPLLKD
jgi:hypothetical protein